MSYYDLKVRFPRSKCVIQSILQCTPRKNKLCKKKKISFNFNRLFRSRKSEQYITSFRVLRESLLENWPTHKTRAAALGTCCFKPYHTHFRLKPTRRAYILQSRANINILITHRIIYYRQLRILVWLCSTFRTVQVAARAFGDPSNCTRILVN